VATENLLVQCVKDKASYPLVIVGGIVIENRGSQLYSNFIDSFMSAAVNRIETAMQSKAKPKPL
jgi:hypothetical protein